MTQPPLTTLRIAAYNLRGKPWRSIALMSAVVIMAFSLFSGLVLKTSLNNGITSLELRLGADIAIVPAGYESDYEGILLSGVPARFYFDHDIQQAVAGIEGVALVTSQFHIASLSSSCCTEEVQIIGIDYETDFVTKPWISQFYGSQIGDGELIAGSAIIVPEDGTLTFFNQKMRVAAQLAKTATGMDYSVFVNRNTAYGLAAIAQDMNIIPQNMDIEKSASVILVKVKSGDDIDYEVLKVVNRIRQDIQGVGVVKSKSLFTNIAENLNIVSGIIQTAASVMGVLAALVLSVLFSINTADRKKEFAVLRIVGATRGKLVRIVLFEALLISLFGSVIGMTFGAIVILPFGTFWEQKMSLPFLMPYVFELIGFSFITMGLSLVAGAISVAFSVFTVSRAETYSTMREGE